MRSTNLETPQRQATARLAITLEGAANTRAFVAFLEPRRLSRFKKGRWRDLPAAPRLDPLDALAATSWPPVGFGEELTVSQPSLQLFSCVYTRQNADTDFFENIIRRCQSSDSPPVPLPPSPPPLYTLFFIIIKKKSV
jgi:hypothetical protein